MPTVKGVKPTDEGEVQLSSGKVVTRYTLEFQVVADTWEQGSATIRSTVGLPLVGYTLYNFNGEVDPNAICVSKKARRHEKLPKVWTVVCSFDSSAEGSDENENNQTETSPPVESWEVEYGEAVMEEDFNEPPKLCLTPCGEKFDPPLVRRLVCPVLVIKRREAAFGGAATILAYVEHANDATFRGAPAGSVQCAGITATKVFEAGVPAWEVTYRFRFSPEGYDAHVLNQGTLYRETAGDTEFKTFLSKSGVPYVGNLKADGTKAGTGEESFSDFRRLPRQNFGALGF